MHSQIVVFPGDSQAGFWENIRMKSKCMAWLGQLFLSLYGSTAGLYLLQHSGVSWGLSLPVLCRWPAPVLCLMTVGPSVLGQCFRRSLPKGPQSGKLPPTVPAPDFLDPASLHSVLSSSSIYWGRKHIPCLMSAFPTRMKAHIFLHFICISATEYEPYMQSKTQTNMSKCWVNEFLHFPSGVEQLDSTKAWSTSLPGCLTACWSTCVCTWCKFISVDILNANKTTTSHYPRAYSSCSWKFLVHSCPCLLLC